MWIKLLLSALIVAFCTFVGYLAAGKWRARKKFYAQLSALNERYLTELSYARKPLGEFLAQYGYTGDFGKTVQALSQRRETHVSYPYLTKEERAEAEDYLNMLGKGDALSQKSYFSAQRAALEEKRTESEREAKARGELSLKLGLLAGLAFVVLIL